jgi:acetyl esterase/lipase
MEEASRALFTIPTMFARSALMLLFAASFSALPAAVVPKSKVDLLADPTFKDWVFHLSENNSVSTRREDVAVIKDGVLQVTGKGFGYFRTKESYQDYHLVLEYKWGENTWSKRKDRARDCGLLLHSHGPDGSFGGSWIPCIQAQMLEGSMGDINVLQGKTKDGKLIPTQLTCEVVKDKKGGLRWHKGGETITVPLKGKSVQSIRWKDRDPKWKDVKGFRGEKDVDHPVGQWNRMEVICDGASYQILLNGVLVNEGRNATPASGFIGVQNEWAECFIRKLELWPLGAVGKPGKPGASVLPPEKWSPADKRLASFQKTPVAVIPLWPGDGTRADDPAKNLVESMPDKNDNILRIQNVTKPTLHLWKPKNQNGRAVIIFPGGGYGILAAQHEGSEIAEWLNKQGITAFLTKYRVPRRKGLPKHTVALQDAQRAIRLVRSRAKEFGISPDKIGVLGFSAGGHLTVHQADKPSYQASDEIDQVSARPDFAIPIYPAYLSIERNGSELDPMVGPLSSRSDYPPIFISIASDDPFTPGALRYLISLQAAKVPYELHIYPRGGHGKGLREVGYPFSQWVLPCERWLKDLN